MNYTLLAGFISFSIVSGFTPGPNNLIALATGANYGYRRTLPHVLGVVVGFNLIYLLIGIGLGSVFKAFPIVQDILKWSSLAYLLFLAWKIAVSKGIGGSERPTEDSKPITFFGSVAFQWINIKAWVAGMTLVTAFTDPKAYWVSLLAGSAINILIAFCSVSSWAVFGTLVKHFLAHPIRLRAFNLAMATLLVLSMVPSILKGE